MQQKDQVRTRLGRDHWLSREKWSVAVSRATFAERAGRSLRTLVQEGEEMKGADATWSGEGSNGKVEAAHCLLKGRWREGFLFWCGEVEQVCRKQRGVQGWTVIVKIIWEKIWNKTLSEISVSGVSSSFPVPHPRKIFGALTDPEVFTFGKQKRGTGKFWEVLSVFITVW